MNRRPAVALFGALVFAAASFQPALAQTSTPPPVPSAAPFPAKTSVPTAPFYFDPAVMDPGLVIGPPPVAGSAAQAADLAEVHRLHDHASPELMKFAQEDASRQNIFLYSTIFGPGFTAQNLPLTAAFERKLRGDSSYENNILKARYKRPRPFNSGDKTLKSECGTATEFSYPSGHSMTAYITGYALAEMVPEKAQEIMARANEFAEHRVVCAVHFPTDIRAGKLVSLEMYGYMLSSPDYQKDMAAAREEVRKYLHLPPNPPQ